MGFIFGIILILIIAAYAKSVFTFILGFASNLIHSFYNEYRVIEILVLLTLGSYALVRKQLVIKKLELLFFIFLIGYFEARATIVLI